MIVELFSICDAATDYAGRLNVLGVFEGIATPQLPVVKDRCTIAARMRFATEEAGNRSVTVRIVDGEGRHPVPDMTATLPVVVPAGRSSTAVNLVLNINGLTIPAFGLFDVVLLVDGIRVANIPLMVAQAKERRQGRNPMEN